MNYKERDDCIHETYCSLCKEIEFTYGCMLKQSEIDELPLLRLVKERIERDRERGRVAG